MSMRKAINDKCRDCICDPLAGGTWREQNGNCIDSTCPLHPYRPLSATQKTGVNRPQPEGLRRFREQGKALQQ